MSELYARLIEREERRRQATEAYFAMLKEEERQHEGTPKKKRRADPDKGHRARFRLLNDFADRDKKEAGLHPGDVGLWFVMWRHATKEGVVKLAQTEMQRCTGLSRNGVRQALERLVESGCVERLKRGGPNAGIATYAVR